VKTRTGTFGLHALTDLRGPINEGQNVSRETKTVNIQTVLRDSNGNTWIGTLGQGLARLPADSNDVRKKERFSHSTDYREILSGVYWRTGNTTSGLERKTA